MAEAWCLCGWHLTATGNGHVNQLVNQHTAHPATCPHHTPGTTT